MKKEILIHFLFLISFFIFITLIKNWLKLFYWPLWIGGLVGTILPDLDHLIYVYFLSPQDLNSQRVNYLIGERNILKSIELLYETRYERAKSILHTAYFQIIFLILTFLVIFSSGSLFGKGLVMAFSLHLIIDEIIDLNTFNNLDNWFKQIPIVLDKQKYTIYWAANLIILFIFIFFL